MKIMTFNTQHCKNYITQEIDFEIMAKTIVDCGADIVGLNEMRAAGEREDYTDQVKKLSDLTGMSHYYFAEATRLHGNNPYGNGFLSRIPTTSVETIAIPDPEVRGYNGYYETRCVLKAVLENGYTVLVTHFGLNPDEQQNAVATVLENLAPEKCILMGDFNVRPDNELLAPIRAKMKDAAEMMEGDGFSFPSDAPNRKIDYIFVTPDVKMISAEVPAIVASDHRPHTLQV
ncbi:MAG: endonuclease/exonuclease/phosphatase family protein [Clostridia bacterium]|nr:endonuclease/exonuclease/phosphatase family protein [Clostridia bacterium]